MTGSGVEEAAAYGADAESTAVPDLPTAASDVAPRPVEPEPPPLPRMRVVSIGPSDSVPPPPIAARAPSDAAPVPPPALDLATLDSVPPPPRPPALEFASSNLSPSDRAPSASVPPPPALELASSDLASGDGGPEESASGDGASDEVVELDGDEIVSSLEPTPPPPALLRAVLPRPKAPRRDSGPAASPPPASAEPATPRVGLWWERLFGADFEASHPEPTEQQLGREVDFLMESLALPAGSAVLDLGCGTGRQAVGLAERGLVVTGVDGSGTRLDRARARARERGVSVAFEQRELRDLADEARFDGLVCWNTTFGYFEEERNAELIKRMFRALRPGGRLVLDVANRDFALRGLPSSAWLRAEGSVSMDQADFDPITSRLRVRRTVMPDDAPARDCAYSIRLYSLHEVGGLLHAAGFRIERVSGALSTPGAFFVADSPRILLVARRSSRGAAAPSGVA